MRGKALSTAISRGEKVYGTLITSTSPRLVENMQGTGLDFVFIDTEHTAIDRHQLSWMCQAYKANDLAPVVRIPSPDPYEASKALDGGASGIIVPYVESVEQVQKLRGAVKLGRLKGERLEAKLTGESELEPELLQYLEDYNEEHLLMINIESVPALNKLDEILQVPQLDAIIIGPHDLSLSLGIPEQYDSPIFDEAVRQIIRKARENNVGAGIHYSYGIEPEIAWIKEEDLNVLIHSSDINLFREKLRDDLKAIQEAVGDNNEVENNKAIDI